MASSITTIIGQAAATQGSTLPQATGQRSQDPALPQGREQILQASRAAATQASSHLLRSDKERSPQIQRRAEGSFANQEQKPDDETQEQKAETDLTPNKRLSVKA